jgi:hypothetical protein
MGVHSGKFFYLNGIDTAGSFSISEQNAASVSRASNTKFAPVRRKGVFTWNGNYQKYGGMPLHMPGDIFSFSGYTAPDNDVAGTAGVIYSGSAIVDSVALNFDWTTGAIIDHNVSFSGHLALTRTSGTMSDATTPDMPPIAVSAGIKWISGLGDISSPNSLPNIATATLNFSAANQAYVNSSTVISGDIWTGRKAGVPDLNMSCTVQDNVRGVSGLPEKGDDIKLKLYINATEFFEIWWLHVRDYTGATYDRRSGAIVQATMNADWNGYFTDGTEGKVVLPDTSEWFPPTDFFMMPPELEGETEYMSAEDFQPSEQTLAIEKRLEDLPEKIRRNVFTRPDPRIILPGVNARPRQGKILDALSMPTEHSEQQVAEVETTKYPRRRSFVSTPALEVSEEALAEQPSAGDAGGADAE